MRVPELDALYLDYAGPLLYNALKDLADAWSFQRPYEKLRGRKPEVRDLV